MKFVLVIYVDGETLHDLIGPFNNKETAFLHVDTIREKLDQEGHHWSFSVWPLTTICE